MLGVSRIILQLGQKYRTEKKSGSAKCFYAKRTTVTSYSETGKSSSQSVIFSAKVLANFSLYFMIDIFQNRSVEFFHLWIQVDLLHMNNSFESTQVPSNCVSSWVNILSFSKLVSMDIFIFHFLYRLVELAEHNPNNPFILYEDEVWTFKQINDLSNQVARAMYEDGRRMNDTVSIQYTVNTCTITCLTSLKTSLSKPCLSPTVRVPEPQLIVNLW